MLELRRELDRRAREVSTLHEAAGILLGPQPFDRRLNLFLGVLVDFLGFSRACYASKSDTDEVVRVRCSCGLSALGAGGDRACPVGRHIMETVVKTGCPFVVPDLSREPDLCRVARASGWDPGTRMAILSVPIRAGNEVVGALGVDREVERHGPLRDEMRVLRTLARFLGHAWLNAGHEGPVLGPPGRPTDGRPMQGPSVGELPSVTDGVSPPPRVSGRGRTRRRTAEDMLSDSPSMAPVFEAIERARNSRATVLIRGESGTGKELVARALHADGHRAARPFVKVVCAAIPEPLLESGLFGHEKGAFTGAHERKRGFLEEANGGTLFLDEIAEIPPATQVKLLRFLQERAFERVGGTNEVRVDVRIIAATNRNLEQMVARGEFREDLYYRLNVVPIVLPPLRDRREDIPLLAEHFLRRYAKEYGKSLRWTPAALRKLEAHAWPGNIRELENLSERLAVLLPGGPIEAERLLLPVEPPGLALAPFENPAAAPAGGTTLPPVQSYERRVIAEALRETKGNQAAAARKLGMSPRQLRYRIRRYHVAVRDVSVE